MQLLGAIEIEIYKYRSEIQQKAKGTLIKLFEKVVDLSNFCFSTLNNLAR